MASKEMNGKKFRQWNLLTALVVLAISAFTYLSTIEPTASFWDCGEFIASSYKLEVGHPPGNPVFQLIARLFTMFTGPDKAAVMVNSMSALCSAFTIFFLYLTIVFLVRRLILPDKDKYGALEEYPAAKAIAVFGSGAVGALAYCFSDTFWFSAVEGEVYAMSSLFTAMVVWAMTKWYEEEDRRFSNRWIVLISFLMGLSIGIHLLNLLAIPMLVFMYYYKVREDKPYSLWELVKIIVVSVVLLGFIYFFMVPLIPKIAAFFDRVFVNSFGLPYNSGAAFFVFGLMALCFWGLFRTLDNGKVFWNTALLCFTTILIGFSLFSFIIIRSSAKTPTNEYQPDNAYTLVRYLSREQYGSTPLLYGQYYGSPYKDIKYNNYWAPLDGKYKSVPGPAEADYTSESKMLFPRMYSFDERHIKFYETYTKGKGTPIAGTEYKKPSFGANLAYFFDFQLGWMYWRYFMWNFVGRQNEIHTPAADLFTGNWESGIGFIDRIRLGDQSNAPDWLKNNKGKNHLFFLPLLLGLIGLFFQFDKDKRGCWLVFLLFVMTGIAIVVYLNQPPYQVRERDYAYAGSFYAFTMWIGLAVAGLYSWIAEKMKKDSVAASVAVTAVCLVVPGIMCAQEWDDHDRSNRYTAVEVAKNYLNSVGPNGLLITHGDNDTFPLWYAQEVEGIRNDVRICNTSLLGTDWYIDQMKYACNNSAPLELSIGKEQYLYGTNEWIPIQDSRDQALLLSDCIAVFKHPDAKVVTQDGRKLDYWVSRKMIIPVNKENCLKSGIVSEKFASEIPDSIVIEIPKGKSGLTKPELWLLDFLSTYQWDRPLNMLNQGGDLNVGIRDYLMFDGFSARFVPFKNRIGSMDIGKVDTDELYHKMTKVFTFDALAREDYTVDYQNLYTFLGVMSIRSLFTSCANKFLEEGENEKAEEMLDKCVEVMKPSQYPYDNSILGWATNALFPVEMIKDYYILGKTDKARALADVLSSEILQSVRFYLDFYNEYKNDFEYGCNLIGYLSNEIRKAGDAEFADKLERELSEFLDSLG